MTAKREIVTAYADLMVPKGSAKSGALDVDMDPPPLHTLQEHWDPQGVPFLAEYKGSGKLANKSALITGGDSGIGRAVAEVYAREGCDVSIVYLPYEQRDAEACKAGVEKVGRRCLLFPGDLTEEGFCERVVKEHVKAFGALHILVNNASKQAHSDSIASLDLLFTRSTFDVNVLSMIALTKFAVPHIPRGGSIITTASVLAYTGAGDQSTKVDYAA